jgi:hypothetical protein
MSFSSDFEGLPMPKGIDWNGGRTAGMVNFGEGQNFVYFYRHSTEDPQASRQAGRRICRGVDHVRIHHPGERLTVVDRPVTDDDKRRWQSQWQQYVNQQQQIPDGTPIDLLYPNYPETGDTLRGCGVHTIEQCANLSADAIQNIGMGAMDASNAAKRYLERAAKGVQHHEIEKMKAEQDQKMRLLTQQNEQLIAQVNHLTNLLQSIPMQGVAPVRDPSVPPQMPTAQPVNVMPTAGIPLPPSWPTVTAPSFIPASVDAQTAQINATHASVEEAATKKRRGWPKGYKKGPDGRPVAPDAPDAPTDH